MKLRDFRPADAEAVHRWFNDDRVTADLVGSRDSFTLDDAAGWVERAMDTSRDRKWAITIDGSDEAVGFVALFGLERQLGPELAVLVGDPSAWGKGVAREAERLACKRAFRDYDAHRIHAEIPATNEAARPPSVSRSGFTNATSNNPATNAHAASIDTATAACHVFRARDQ